MEVVFQPSIFTCYVSFREGILKKKGGSTTTGLGGFKKSRGFRFSPRCLWCGALEHRQWLH